MKYYNELVSEELTQKLYDAGMPLPLQFHNGVLSGIHVPCYSDIIDWLMEKGLFVNIEPIWDFANERITEDFESVVIRRGSIHTPTPTAEGSTWHEAATKAIEKALTLI